MTHIERPEALRYELVRLHREAQRHYPRQSHHARDAELCLRRLFYTWQGYVPDNPTPETMVGDMGTAAEEFVTTLLDTDELAMAERNVKIAVAVGDRELRGKMDFLLIFRDSAWQTFFPKYEHKPVPLEVKSLSTHRYEEQNRKGPYSPHVGQLNVYVCASEAPFGLLMYLQREGTEEIPFNFWLVQPDRLRYAQVRKRLGTLNSYLDLEVVPPPLCRQDKLDPYCPWMKVRCPRDGGWPNRLCPKCGDP